MAVKMFTDQHNALEGHRRHGDWLHLHK